MGWVWSNGGVDQMIIGDLIRFEASEDNDERMFGTILRFSTYEGGCGHGRSQPPERIIEVLWNTGELGWILAERVEVASA
jgi:hypothetical protein